MKGDKRLTLFIIVLFFRDLIRNIIINLLKVHEDIGGQGEMVSYKWGSARCCKLANILQSHKNMKKSSKQFKPQSSFFYTYFPPSLLHRTNLEIHRYLQQSQVEQTRPCPFSQPVQQSKSTLAEEKIIQSYFCFSQLMYPRTIKARTQSPTETLR